jgi:hypothetical protein
MWKSKIHYRAFLGVLLSFTVVIAFTLSSFAASVDSGTFEEGLSDDILIPQVLTGTLTARGNVLVNGNEAKTGATVADGSVIQTRTGAHALIELGAPGRVELDPITAITLSMTPTSIQASLNKCGRGVTLILPAGVSGLVKILNITDVGVLNTDREVEVRVIKGEAVVKYGQGKERTLKAGEHRQFDDATDVTAVGDGAFKVLCDKDHYPLALWAGLAAIAIPVADVVGGGEGPIVPVLSQLNP